MMFLSLQKISAYLAKGSVKFFKFLLKFAGVIPFKYTTSSGLAPPGADVGKGCAVVVGSGVVVISPKTLILADAQN